LAYLPLVQWLAKSEPIDERIDERIDEPNRLGFVFKALTNDFYIKFWSD
jgi:hypothetical protein